MVGVYLNVSIFGPIEMYTIALNFVSQSSNDLTGVLKLSNGWNLDMYVFFSRQIINGEEKWKVNIFKRNTTQVMAAFVLSSIFKCREKQQKKRRFVHHPRIHNKIFVFVWIDEGVGYDERTDQVSLCNKILLLNYFS